TAKAETPAAPESMAVELTEAQIKTVGMEFGKIEMRNISGVVKANGMLAASPQNMASVSSPVEGVVRMTNLMPGSRVSKGQALAFIRNPDLIQMQQEYLQTQHELADNRSQLEYLEAEYKRQQELAKEQVNAGKTVQQAKAQYESIKARIEGLRAQSGGLAAKLRLIGISPDGLRADNFRSEISLRAPVSGFVTEVNTNSGKRVSPTDVLFVITGTGALLAKLNVFEKDLPKIRAGQTVRFSLANDARGRSGKVLQIGKEIGADRTVPVFCSVGNLGDVLPGAYLSGLIETGGANVSALPEAAVVGFEGKDYIFTAAQADHQAGEGRTHFEMVEVTKGLSENGFTEITLPEGMDGKVQVVVKGAFDLLAKMKNSEEE
ncbi:MAG: efflux RND transporter periplasmic adaptor subunit, partial [Saprospiraceae bacterium]